MRFRLTLASGLSGEKCGEVARADVTVTSGGALHAETPIELTLHGSGLFALLGAANREIEFTQSVSLTLDGSHVVDVHGGNLIMGYRERESLAIVPDRPRAMLDVIVLPWNAATSAVGTGFGISIGPDGNAFFDMVLGGNLNGADFTAALHGGPAGPTHADATIYDVFGEPHVIQFAFTPLPPSAGGVDLRRHTVRNPHGVSTTVGSQWSWRIIAADTADPVSTIEPSSGYLFFDESGRYINSSSDITGQTNTYGWGPTAFNGTEGNVFRVFRWGTNWEAPPAMIAVDFSSLTAHPDVVSVHIAAQNGCAAEDAHRLIVTGSGTIALVYGNGVVDPVGRLAVATFANPDGLLVRDNGIFASTLSSGVPRISTLHESADGWLVAKRARESAERGSDVPATAQ